MATPILMTEKYWMNSQFSVARYYGGATINGESYHIVNKHGETLQEISIRMTKAGEKGKAIEPGEPADLVRQDWIPVYKKLGRERVMELIENNVPLEKAKKMKR